MRIAWIGPMPSNEGGAGGVSNLLLREFNARGIEIDCYVPGHEHNLPRNLQGLQYVHFICSPSSWEWNRWYSRNRLLGFITGQIANLRSESSLARTLLTNHLKNPYDVIYQFSHIEFSALRKLRLKLPPIVLHPSVHAFGELRSMRLERHLAVASEPLIMRIGARVMLNARSYVQKRHIHYADLVLALSENFANDLSHDYGVPSRKIRLIPNPVDLKKFTHVTDKGACNGRMTVLFISRISVRKGVEMVIDLSHRLDDLGDIAEILIVGDKSMWSDYTSLLSQLNHRVARFIGPVGSEQIKDLYQNAAILIQPSHYEPFGLTVGEALASGVPVVASNKVGAAEGVDPLPCKIYRHDDIDGLEREVRQLVCSMQQPQKREEMRYIARTEACRMFSVEQIATKLIECLRLAMVESEPSVHRIRKRA